jgi:hypothetical protein
MQYSSHIICHFNIARPQKEGGALPLWNMFGKTLLNKQDSPVGKVTGCRLESRNLITGRNVPLCQNIHGGTAAYPAL